MICPSCQQQPPDGSQFCNHCGAQLELRCSSCNNVVPPGSRFCNSCGHTLGETETTESQRKPRDYTPRHLADKILQSKSALEGERKQVTVLFADVKGSMELAEQVDPEEWHGILDRFFQILADGVHRFEGTVNQYTGDGIMALFGAPIAHEDHAQRACWAGLWLRDELRRYADDLRVERGLNFGTRIGVNSGEVVVGKIGDDLRMDYTAQGHTVGLAQRMEQLAPSEKVYLTESTARLVEGFFRVRSLGESAIRGVTEPVGIYELEDVGPARSRLDASRLRGFTRFVGRQDEMSTLEAALHRAVEGHGQVVGVVGEAGVGKSRLCAEFVERCRASGTRVLEAHCPAHGKALPLLPILDLLRDSFAITEQDSDQLAREKIAGRLLLLDEAFSETLPLVFDFLGVPDPDRPAPRIDPEARQRQLFSFARRLVHARSEREPAVLFFDDLHWIDAASDGFLAQFVEATGTSRTLLLVNFRPEYAADWTRKSYYQQLPVMLLGPEQVVEMITDLLGSDPSVADLPALIRERTGGNPFFTEEVILSLVESGALEGERGAYHLARPIGELEVPVSVQALLAARIDRLPEREKQVLHTAAVIGREFSEPLLSAVVDLPAQALASSLSQLQSAEFVVEQAIYPVAEFVFKHPLTEQVARESQLQERRRRIHAAVARGIEELHGDKLDEMAALLAHHWEQAGEAREAARWHLKAAEWAGSSEAIEADAHLRKVEELLESLERSQEADEWRLAAISDRMLYTSRVGMHEDEADALFATGRRLARDRDDLRGLALLEMRYGVRKGSYNRFDESLEHSRRAVRAAREFGDVALEVGMLPAEARALLWLGRWEELDAVIERGLELAGGAAGMGSEIFGFSPLLTLELFRAHSKGFRGRPGEATAIFDCAIDRAQEIGDLDVLQYLHGDAVLTQFALGDASRALQHGRQGVEIAERIAGTLHRILATHYLCWAQVAAGDWVGALESIERVAELSHESGVGLEWRGPLLALRSMAELGLGQAESARISAREAVSVLSGYGGALFEWAAHLSLARALMSSDPAPEPEEAEAALSAMKTSFEAIEARVYEPFWHEARAELAQLRGDHTARERELREAHRLYSEMDAVGHAERLARELERL